MQGIQCYYHIHLHTFFVCLGIIIIFEEESFSGEGAPSCTD